MQYSNSVAMKLQPASTMFDTSRFLTAYIKEEEEIEKYLASCPAHIKKPWKSLLSRLFESGTMALATSGAKVLCKRRCPGLDEIRLAIASDPETPASVLNAISAGSSNMVLERIAEHANVSEDLLDILATNRSCEVRMAVCENRKTRAETLWLLATDNCPDVRFRLAETAATKDDVLQALMEDDNPYVASRAGETLIRKIKAQTQRFH